MVQPASPSALDIQIAAVRAINRYYTRQIGLLDDGFLQSRFTLTEARVLFELAGNDGVAASRIAEELGLDAGYLSRILRRFQRDGLLTRIQSAEDRRRSGLRLTDSGRAAFAPLDQRSRDTVSALLGRLPEPAREALIGAMHGIERLMTAPRSPDWTTHGPNPGDVGWVIQRHAALYAEEYGFDRRFEALVARVGGAFLAERDPATEQAWIAERDGIRVGSVFLVRQSAEHAKLRLLLVEPSARGLGIGRGLVRICIERARELGYRRMTLWTNDILLAARGSYRAAGFHLIASAPHSDFGPPMVGEEWELPLDASR